MSIESFLKRWTIRESTTSLIAVGDRLHIGRVANSDKVKFWCESNDPDIVRSWDDISNCAWHAEGDPEGHLAGTISDQVGTDYDLLLIHAGGNLKRIHIEISAIAPASGEALAGGGGGSGSAGGDDDPK